MRTLPYDNRPQPPARTVLRPAATGGAAVYLDCNATAPSTPRSAPRSGGTWTEEYGNAGSRTHQYGQAAKDRVNQAREQVPRVVACQPDEVIFTSGATESDNLALLGIAPHGDSAGRRHMVSTRSSTKPCWNPWSTCRARIRDDARPPGRSG